MAGVAQVTDVDEVGSLNGRRQRRGTAPDLSHWNAGLCMEHDEATEGSAFNIDAMPFIERLCHFIDFENFQSYVLRLLASQCENRSKKICPNPIPLVVWMRRPPAFQ